MTVVGPNSQAGTMAPTGDKEVAEFLILVGERVKNERGRNRMPRRLLAETSGLSQRYLAQLEGGKGNISIGLLLKVANALNVPVEHLLGPSQAPAADADPRAKRVALIGLRGAGKSTLGRLAAKETSVQFEELNDHIERASGMPIHEVIALYGQEGYRSFERQALDVVVKSVDSVILAVAGGITEQPGTFEFLLRNFHTIWLRAEPEDHMQRVLSQGDNRPMAKRADAMSELRVILASRNADYARADARLDTSSMSIKDSRSQLVQLIRDNIS